MRHLFLSLPLLLQALTPNDFDSDGRACTDRWPQYSLDCPPFCVKVDPGGRDEGKIRQACGSLCLDNEVLFHDGTCTQLTNSTLCPDNEGKLQLNDLGLYHCQGKSLDVTASPCDCISNAGRVYQACPRQGVSHSHYSPGLDFHPPKLETMQTCQAQLHTGSPLTVLTGERDLHEGFLQCPLTVSQVSPYSMGGWTFLAVVYVVTFLTIVSWCIYKLLKERRVNQPGRPPVSLFESPLLTEMTSPQMLGKEKGTVVPIERQETGLDSQDRFDTSAVTLSSSGLMGQVGYKQPLLGKAGLISFVTVVVSKPLLMIVYILDGYGFFGTSFCPEETAKCLAAGKQAYSFRLGWPCGAHCLVTDAWSTGINPFWPYNKNPYGGKMYLVAFIHTWILGVVIFLAAIAARTSIRAAFRLLSPLESADLIEVQVPARERLKVERNKGDLMDRYMAWENSVVSRWFGTRVDRKICKIQIDSDSGTRYFTFRSQRYIWSKGQFQKAEIDIGTSSCRSLVSKHDTRSGLTSMEASKRISLLGLNLISIPMPSLKRSLFDEFFRLDFIYQLFCLLVWCVFYYWFAATIVFLVCLVSCSIRIRSKRQSQQRLKNLAETVTNVTVIREGAKRTVASDSLAVGDIVVVQTSHDIPADLVLLSGTCVMNESALTGEPNPVPKVALQSIDRPYDPKFLDSKSTLYAGTSVTAIGSDSVRAVVSRIGAETDRGRMLAQIMTPTKLSFKFDRQWNAVFGILLCWGFINVLIGVALFNWELEGWYYGIFTISQVMSPLLPAVFVSGQATTARRLARDKRVHCVNLQRTMVAGKVKTVCFDKTGTLTEAGLSMNKLKLYDADRRSFEPSEIRTLTELRSFPSNTAHLLETSLKLCHELQLSYDGSLVGQDVDSGMFEWSEAKIVPGGSQHHRVGDTMVILDVPANRSWYILRHFEFLRASMSSSVVTASVSDPTSLCAYTKGSWESVSEMCNDLHEDLDHTVNYLAGQGLYVLAVAQRDLGHLDIENVSRDMCETDLNLLGLIVFKNALLPDTADVIRELKQGDCHPVMVTGDHYLTACKIAQDCSILDGQRTFLIHAQPQADTITINELTNNMQPVSTVNELTAQLQPSDCIAITGAAFDVLHQPFVDPQLLPLFPLLLTNTKVFARMTPQHKVKVVELFMVEGVTAMVGDGANDAAALERSHCGIAVRSGAAGAAKEASVVAHFASEEASLQPVVDVLRHGRCALSMTTAAYKNLIVYGEVMVCLSFIEMYLKVVPPEAYFIMVDAVVNSGMTWAIMRTRPAKRLAPKRPSSSLLGYEVGISTILQILCHWIWAGITFISLYQQGWFQCRQFDPRFVDHADWWTKGDNYEATVLGLLCTFQWITVGPTFNFSGGFRRTWIKNYEVWIMWILFILVGLSLLWTTGTSFSCMFRTNCGDASLLNSWFAHKTWNGVVQNPIDIHHKSIFVPPGCDCYDPPESQSLVAPCESEYHDICLNNTFNSAFHHNILPWDFRKTLTYLFMGNMLCAFILERVFVLGPIGKRFRRRISN